MAELKLGRCPRCKAYALVADLHGIRHAIDVAPANALRFGQAVGLGVGLWWVVAAPGGARKLSGAYSGPQSRKQPSWAPGGAQSGSDALHTEHSCGALARDVVLVSVQRPPSAPATPGSPRGGHRPPDAPAGAPRAPQPRSPAPPATRRPSRLRALRCDTCRRLIDREAEAYTAIETDTYRWGVHEECP